MQLRNQRTTAFPPNSTPDIQAANDIPPPPKKNRSVKPLLTSQKATAAGKKLVRGSARGSWTKEALDSAIDSIEDGVFSIRKAGIHFGIPQTTLRNHLYGKTKNKFGSIPKGLTIEEEKLLVQWALQLADEGRAVNLDIMKQKVAEMTIQRQTCFKDGLPGKKWWKSFRGRHPEISFRTAQCIEMQRVKALTTSNLQNFYSTLRSVYDKYDFDASRIWNCDESGVQAGCRTGMRVIARKGQKNVTEHIPKSREWMTVLVCVNASGSRIPNLYVFKGKRMRNQNLVVGCEPGAVMAFQKKAWITDELFEAWLDHFKNNVPGGVSKERPHLLICDGHGSHVNMATIMKAREIGLHIVQLPPHTSHRLQPLDVACFHPFKLAFRKLRAQFMHSKYGVEPLKEDLAAIVSQSLSQALTSSNVQAGFLKTGIWPWEPPRVQPEPLADKMESERLAAGRCAASGAATNASQDVVDAEDDAGADENDANVADVTGNVDDNGNGNGLAALAALVSNLPSVPNGRDIGTVLSDVEGVDVIPPSDCTVVTIPSTSNPKPKAKRLKLPENLKGKLLVTSDQMVQARIEHQRLCEEAARVRQDQLEEKKKLQAQRKEAKEQEKKRREENKKLREEKRAAMERASLERAAAAALEEQEVSVSRPKRLRKKTKRMLESEAQDLDEGPLIIKIDDEHVTEQVLETVVAHNHDCVVDIPDDENVSCSQGVDLIVNLTLDASIDSQIEEIEDDDENCRKKRKLSDNRALQDSSDEEFGVEEKIKALDDLYRIEADTHLKNLGL